VDGNFGYVDLALIEFTSMSGRGVLYLVQVANGATEHVRKDFIALRGDSHSRFLSCIGDDHPRGAKIARLGAPQSPLAKMLRDF
jgi:hypothetical protein